jgi:hypothetical protein
MNLLDQYKNVPCALCGQVTEHYILWGNTKNFDRNLPNTEGTIIKMCEHCGDCHYWSTYGR